MQHSKKQHTEQVSVCWKFLDGNCDFGNDFCWFLHDTSTEKMSIKSKCKVCDSTYNSRAALMKHKKYNHAEMVPDCKNMIKCEYSDKNCWFNHSDKTEDKNKKVEKENHEDKILLQKLMELVEKISERLIIIETNQK